MYNIRSVDFMMTGRLRTLPSFPDFMIGRFRHLQTISQKESKAIIVMEMMNIVRDV